MLRFVPRDRRAAGECQLPARANRRDARLDFVRIDSLRRRAFQAEQNRLVGAVSFAGQRERSVQPHFDFGAAIEHARRRAAARRTAAPPASARSSASSTARCRS